MYPDAHVILPGPDWNASLMTLEDLAPLLGLTLPLTEPLASQVPFATEGVSRLIRQYVGRNLSEGSFTEFFGQPGFLVRSSEGGALGVKVNLTEWPVTEITALTVNGVPRTFPPATINHSLGTLWLPWEGQPLTQAVPIGVEYVGGYDPLPADVKGVFLDLVRRQLAAMGANLAAGGSTIPAATAPIKAVTVGALKVEYAVASQPAAAGAAGGASPFTTDAVAGYASTLDEYRSVRKVAATIS